MEIAESILNSIKKLLGIDAAYPHFDADIIMHINILAALDKVQIAESLSQVAVTEIIGVVLAYCIKSAIENLSKNNNWPDKSGGDPPGVG